MQSTQIQLTPDGRQKLADELAWREGEHAKEITESIKTAKDFGDLSENAEYDAAKEEQARNEARCNEIRQILANAVIVDKAGVADAVSIGSTVTLEDGSTGKEMTLSIVGTTETNSLEHKISTESPVGAALLGHRKGDEVTVTSPNGSTRTYTVLSIERS